MSSTQATIDVLSALDAQLGERLAASEAEAEAARQEWEAIKALRTAIQRKVEELERAFNSASQNASRINDEYERLGRLRERAANAMALRPPDSPQAPKRAVRAIKDIPRLLADNDPDLGTRAA